MAKVKVDMTNVEASVRCQEGQHVARLKSMEEKDTQNGDPMLVGKFEVIKGNSTGAIVYENFPLVENALWKLKSYLEVIGVKADKKITLDTDKLIGKVCIIEVAAEEYKGSKKAKIAEFLKYSPKKSEEPDEDEDDIDEDEEEEVEEKPKKTTKKPAKRQPEPEEDEDEDDEDEEEEEETPAQKKKRLAAEKAAKEKKAAAKKPAKKQVEEDDDDNEWDEE